MEQDLQQLVYHYGTETEKLLEQATVLLKQYPQADDFQAALLISQVLYGVHEEMAIHLTDVVLRRTGLGSAGHPGNEELALCADVMAAVLDWSEQRHQMELAQVKNFYARQFSRPSLLANLGG
jgi:glycerol-3-phosphate dehydrogenase